MRPLFLSLICLILFGCNSENSVSSARSIERLMIGTWVVPNPFVVDEGPIDFADWRHIVFDSDGTFDAPWGIGGPDLHEFNGSYWVNGPFLGARGVGGVEGQGRIHVQFVYLELTSWNDPEALGLQITHILPDYITSLGFDLDAMSSGGVQDVLKRLNDTAPPTNALGQVRTFHKAQRILNL